MSQTVSTAAETEILNETYADLGVVRFRRAEKERGWWICLSDMAALFPDSDGEPFSLEGWLNLNPDTMAALDRFLERKGEEVWGVYSIAIELARFPQSHEFRGFPLWIATKGRRTIE